MIRLEEAVLTSFGKFQKKRICFSDGLQIIYGDNEAGKSTLQMFLRMMLYGAPVQKRGVLLKERTRVIPWGEKHAEGSLILTVDGRRIEVHRRFGKTPAGDTTEVMDSRTGETLSEYKGETLGEKLLGIPSEVFEKTFWIHQDSSFPVGADEGLSRRLMNLQETGEEELSASAIRTALEQEMRRLRAKDKRSKSGVIDRLLSARESKVQERYRLLTERDQRKAVKLRQEEAMRRMQAAEETAASLKALEERQKHLRELDMRRAKWMEIQRLRDHIAEVESGETYQRFQTLSAETLEEAERQKRRIEALDQTQEIGYDKETAEAKAKQTRLRKYGRRWICLGGILLLAGLLVGVLRIPFWQWFLLLGVLTGAAGIGTGIWMQQNAERAQNALTLARMQAEQEAANLREQRARLQRELDAILSRYDCQTTEELRLGLEQCRRAQVEAESCRKACESLLADGEAELSEQELAEIQAWSAEDTTLLQRDLTEELRKNQQIQMETLSLLKELEGKLSYVYHGGRNPADAEAEIMQIDAELAEAEQRVKAVQLATEVFEQVYETRKSDFTPLLNERVNAFLDILSLGRYRDIRVSETYRMRVGTEDAHLMEAEYFSRGTYEQIYFALRLALGDLIGDGNEPLFLDDFLASYDDLRAKAAVELLARLGARRQVLLFTCHGRVREFGLAVGAVINMLEEEIEDGSGDSK